MRLGYFLFGTNLFLAIGQMHVSLRLRRTLCISVTPNWPGLCLPLFSLSSGYNLLDLE